MKQSKKVISIFVLINFFLLIIWLILAVRLGSVHITFSHIFDSIFNYSETLELMLVRDLRIPRALSVIFVGGILGITGTMIQGVTRNPIAEPSILGVSQGLCFRNRNNNNKCVNSIFYRSIYNRNYCFNFYNKKKF